MKELKVLFENNFCFVLDKPQGLPVQGGAGIKNSVDSILSEKINPRPFLVHRLDKDTSGVLLVAKNLEAARYFSLLFGSSSDYKTNGAKDFNTKRKIVKQYTGLCFGLLEKEQGVIKINLDVKGKRQERVQKDSETLYRLISTIKVFTKDAVFTKNEAITCSLLELKLETGRMHQIRRHLAILGNPLLGDDKYGNFPLNKMLKKEKGLKYLLLHASRLILPPSDFLPEGLDITAALPDYFSDFLKSANEAF